MSERTEKAYQGYKMVESDLVKELAWALLFVCALVVVLALAFSSPDEPTLTSQQVAQSSPLVLLQTGLNALDGKGAIASYGPPYNHGQGSVQSLGAFSPQTWVGVTIPINAAQLFVLHPLQNISGLDPDLATALRRFRAASPAQQATWEDAYQKALGHARVAGQKVQVPAVASGPLAKMMQNYLALGRSGLLDGAINRNGRVYQTDFTRALLLTENTAVGQLAATHHMLGTQWGMMKEPGSYPGAVWLWFYTLLYQLPFYATSPAVDLLVGLTVGGVTVILMFVPWIPGLRDIPYYIKIHRLIWRNRS